MGISARQNAILTLAQRPWDASAVHWIRWVCPEKNNRRKGVCKGETKLAGITQKGVCFTLVL